MTDAPLWAIAGALLMHVALGRDDTLGGALARGFAFPFALGSLMIALFKLTH